MDDESMIALVDKPDLSYTDFAIERRLGFQIM